MASPPEHLLVAAFREGSALALTHLEEQLVWLTKKVRRDKDLIERAQIFFDDHQYYWSRAVMNLFLIMLEGMKDRLYYEEHRLELLAWKIVEAREGSEYVTRSLPLPRGRNSN